MKRKYVTLNLTLFDEGGAIGAGTGSEGGSAAAEGAGEKKSGSVSEGQPATDGNETDNLDAEFEDLIKGKYKKQFDSRVQRTISKRIKASKADAARQEAENAKVKKMIGSISSRYGLQNATLDDALSAIEKDDRFLEEAAAKAGMSPEQYRTMTDLQQRLDQVENEKKEALMRSMRQEFEEKLQQQVASCQQQFPSFDFESECANETFINLLKDGADVTSAFKFIHMDEILSGAMAMAVKKGAEQTAAAVRSNLQRPTESAGGGAVSIGKNYDKMTDEEFDAYLEKVKSGEI